MGLLRGGLLKVFTRCVLSLILSASGTYAQVKVSGCTPVPRAQHTLEGNLTTVVDLRSRPVAGATGIIRPLNGSVPIKGVLVEVFPFRHGEGQYASRNELENSSGRLSACITQKGGRFGFDLPAGTYRIIASNLEYHTRELLIVVDDKKGATKPLLIELTAGT